jgi:hypothetical protein
MKNTDYVALVPYAHSNGSLHLRKITKQDVVNKLQLTLGDVQPPSKDDVFQYIALTTESSIKDIFYSPIL